MTPILPGNVFTLTPPVYGRHLKVQDVMAKRLVYETTDCIRNHLQDLRRLDTYLRSTDPEREVIKHALSTELERRRT